MIYFSCFYLNLNFTYNFSNFVTGNQSINQNTSFFDNDNKIKNYYQFLLYYQLMEFIMHQHKPNAKLYKSKKPNPQNQDQKQIKYIQKINEDLHECIQINPFLNTVTYRCMLLKNGLPIIYKSKVPEIARVLSDINSHYKAMSVIIDPETKLIYFKCSSLFKSKEFKQISNQANAYLEQLHQFVKKEIKQISLRIQLKLGQVIQQQQYYKTLNLRKNDYRMNWFRKQSQIIKQLNKLVSISHIHFQFMDHEYTKPQPISKSNASESTSQNESSQNIQYDNNEAQQQNKDDEDKLISKKQEQHYIKLLIHSKIKKSKLNERTNIYSQIKILKVQQIKWLPLTEGAFGLIQRANVKYYHVENEADEYITKIIVKKSDKLGIDSSKVQQEKEILNLLKDYTSVNIIKCYYTDQKYNKINLDLLIDFYTFRSLAHYIKRTEKCLSLNTKVLLICQVIQGMRFLRDLGIVHHDLKADNLLIGKSLFLRITDFGQSVHLGSSKKKKSGYTIPFVAPQRFNKNQPITPKVDTFSIGIIIHWLIFQQFPFIMREMSKDKLIKEYEKNKSVSRAFITQEKLKYHGPVQILRIIYTICLKCLHSNLNMRPDLDWIQIILRRLLDYYQ